MLSFAEET